MSLSHPIRFVAACLLLLFTTQCSKKDLSVPPTIAALIGTWQLIEPDSTYGVTLQFAYDPRNPPQDITPFNAGGKSAVNAYTVRLFATIDGTLTADKLGSTEIAGSPKAMQFEQTYYANLKAVARYELSTQTQLRLYHGGQQPGVLVYEKMK